VFHVKHGTLLPDLFFIAVLGTIRDRTIMFLATISWRPDSSSMLFPL